MTPSPTAREPRAATAARPGRFDAEGRRRIGHAARLWGLLTLSGVALLGVLVAWHLIRRGRLIRDRLGPPRNVRLPEFEAPTRPPPSPEDPRP